MPVLLALTVGGDYAALPPEPPPLVCEVRTRTVKLDDLTDAQLVNYLRVCLGLELLPTNRRKRSP